MTGRRRRGQATVELSLGLLVFVTVLLGAFYFAEFFVLRLRAQQAVNFALWDATGQQVHRHDALTGRTDWTPYRAAIAAAGPNASARYADFDGRSVASGRGGLTQVVTRANPVVVTCQEDPTVPRVVPSPIAVGPLPAGDPLPPGDSGMACQARLEIGALRVPTHLADTGPGALFSAPHWSRLSISACAPGTGGACPNRYRLLLDDWGFSGPEERKECRLNHGGNGCGGQPGTQNNAYWSMVDRIAGSSGAGSEASELARFVAGTSPVRESQFFMSFRGSESAYRETIPGPGESDPTWETTPFTQTCRGCGFKPYAVPRTQCWLGKDCDPRHW